MDFLNTKDKILYVAEKLFADNGFTATTVRDIANTADVNVAMISYYFGSKEQLIEQVFRNKMAEYNKYIQFLLDSDTSTYIEKVHNIITHYVEQFFIRESLARIMINVASLPLDNNLHELVLEFRISNFFSFQKIIKQGQAAKEFKEEVDLPLLMLSMTGTLFNNIASRNYYRKLHHFENMPEEQFVVKFKDTLCNFFKTTFERALLNKHESN
jgi:AcrR family transcriptional regulator